MEIFLVLLKLTCSWRSILISSGWSPIQCSKSSCICPLELFIPASWSTLLCYLRTWDGNDLATLWQSRTCASQNFFQFLRLIRSFQCQLQFCLHSVLDSRTRSSFWGSSFLAKPTEPLCLPPFSGWTHRFLFLQLPSTEAIWNLHRNTHSI